MTDSLRVSIIKRFATNKMLTKITCKSGRGERTHQVETIFSSINSHVYPGGVITSVAKLQFEHASPQLSCFVERHAFAAAFGACACLSASLVCIGGRGFVGHHVVGGRTPGCG